MTIRGTDGIGIPCRRPGCDSAGTINVTRSSITSTGVAVNPEMNGSVEITASQVHGGGIFSTINGAIGVHESTLHDVQLGCSESGISISRSRMLDTTVFAGSYCSLDIRDNTIRSTSGGTAISPGYDPFSTSTLDGNRFFGWDVAIEAGATATNVQITSNRFEDNGTGIGTGSGTIGCSNGPALPSGAIRDNVLVRNRGNAIQLDCGQWAVGGNRMIRNIGLGFSTTGPSTQVNITDEGGNIASRNAEPQCVGIVCLPR